MMPLPSAAEQSLARVDSHALIMLLKPITLWACWGSCCPELPHPATFLELGYVWVPATFKELLLLCKAALSCGLNPILYDNQNELRSLLRQVGHPGP